MNYKFETQTCLNATIVSFRANKVYIALKQIHSFKYLEYLLFSNRDFLLIKLNNHDNIQGTTKVKNMQQNFSISGNLYVYLQKGIKNRWPWHA